MQRARSILALAAALALVVLAWLWAKERPSTTSGTPQQTVERPDESPSAALHPGPIESAREPELAAPTTLAEPAGAQAVSPSAGLEELRIVTGLTQAPVAGARVWWIELDDAGVTSWNREGLGPLERANRLEREGLRHLSDELGRVRLPSPRGNILALARHGELFGLRWFNQLEPRPWTLEVFSNNNWVVRVRDVRGEPIVGLPIVWSGGGLLRIPTDKHGIATLNQASWFLARSDNGAATVAPRVLLARPQRLMWSGRVPPTEPSEFTLPELGEVQVLLRDPDGRAWDLDAQWPERVEIRAAPGANVHGAEAAATGEYRWLNPSEGLRIHAQVGLELETRVLGAGLSEILVRSAGPTRANELVPIEIHLGAESPIARMRVYGPDGAPLVHARIGVKWRSDDRAGGTQSTDNSRRSDRTARLCVPLDRPSGESTSTLLLVAAEHPSAQALLAIPRDTERGWLDFGDVQLKPAPLIAAGQVVDAAGAPVVGATVTVMAMIAARDPARASGAPGGGQRASERPASSGYGLHATSDERGRFEVRSADDVVRVRVSAEFDGCESAEIKGPVGLENCVLRIEDVSVRGRVLLPANIHPDELRMDLESESASISGYRLATDASWSFAGLATGPASVEIYVDETELVLGRAEFEVLEGTTVEAPEIDLRALRVRTVYVTNAQGEPLDCAIEYAAPGSEESDKVHARRGRARLITPHARLDASFHDGEYRSMRIENIRDGAHIVLERDEPESAGGGG